jgi:hypothetical protein
LASPAFDHLQDFPVDDAGYRPSNRQAEIMMRIASEFGLTPASRSRISTPVNTEPSLFVSEDFLKRQ